MVRWPRRPGTGWAGLGHPAARAAGLMVAALAVVLIGLSLVATLVASSGHGSAHRVAPATARPFALSRLGNPGRQVTLAGYRGQPVVLNFFASWCGPCKKETPTLARFFRSEHGRVLIVGIDTSDRTGAALAFVRAAGVSYPVAFDPSFNVAISYGITALPQTVFLNGKHQIVRHVVGAVTQRELDSWAASLHANA
jgi:cytochrome c biogenesis protein CcmG, thiol:disulfide interchange protein DsbE